MSVDRLYAMSLAAEWTSLETQQLTTIEVVVPVLGSTVNRNDELVATYDSNEDSAQVELSREANRNSDSYQEAMAQLDAYQRHAAQLLLDTSDEQPLPQVSAHINIIV